MTYPNKDFDTPSPLFHCRAFLTFQLFQPFNDDPSVMEDAINEQPDQRHNAVKELQQLVAGEFSV
jgi:hypothetical protein